VWYSFSDRQVSHETANQAHAEVWSVECTEKRRISVFAHLDCSLHSYALMDIQKFNTVEMIEATRQSFSIIEPWAEATCVLSWLFQ
jgi:hypothetical protein